VSVEKITVIGLGTLGSALCKNISETESLDELIIVDYDIVESKNVHNSIYEAPHIGEYKVDALKDILKSNIKITPINTVYEEGKTRLPASDLIVDCRDVVCDRGSEIDVRLYISGRILIVDCRKNVKTQYNYEGSYRRQLSRNELNKAGFFAAQILCSEEIWQIKKNNSVQRMDLNLLPSILNREMKKSLDNIIDIIYEESDAVNRLQCLPENIEPIINLNKKQDVNVFIGEKELSTLCLPEKQIIKLPELAKTKFSIIPHNTLKNSTDLINALSDIVKQQNNLVNFIVTIRKENGETFVELLEETGAA